MAPEAGWYDDPRDATRLRYWDGSAWTEHLTPKPAAASSAPAPQWTYPGGQAAAQQEWHYGTAAPPTSTTTSAPDGRPLTPDGVRVTRWGKRVGAKLLDLVIVALVSIPITGYLAYRAGQAVSDELNARSTASAFTPDDAVLRWEIPLFAVYLVLLVVYEAISLRRWGATPGQRSLEISVREYARAGQLPWSVIARRAGFMYGLWALNLVPVVSVLSGILLIVNYLWPLWDHRNQALHDKVAGTVVVEGARALPLPASAQPA